jgi:predicted glycosyltransferase
MMDYEHQPANHLAYRLADRVIVPECYPERELRKQGAAKKSRRYAGFKEEITLAGFVPDPNFRKELDVEDDVVLAVARPAAEGALYHRHRNEIFDQVLEHLVAGGATVLLTPRNKPQAEAYARRGVRVLANAVDGRNLLAASDLVVGAGGTMTREAALLHVPTYSLFSGRPAAVDAALAGVTPLRYVREPGEIRSIEVKRKSSEAPAPDETPIRRMVDLIEGEAQALRP